jgi:hypothetical protein
MILVDIHNKENPLDRRTFDIEANAVPEGMTTVQPHGFMYYPALPKQHWDEENQDWVLEDDCTERRRLDDYYRMPALAIRRAMSTLPSQSGEVGKSAEDDLDDLFLQYPKFEKEWVIAYPSNIINLNDSAVKDAMALLHIDIDYIKRKILGIPIPDTDEEE